MNKTKYIIVSAFACFFTLGIQAQNKIMQQPEAGKPVRIELGKYENFKLANGLQVIVVEDHRLPRVSFSLRLDVDLVMQKENVGYQEAVGNLLRTGTTTKSKSQIDEQIDFLGASLNTSATSISGSCLSKHTDTFLPILSDILYNPTFSEEELDKWKKQTYSALAHEKTEPGAIASNVGNKLMFGDAHPYGEIKTEATVATITTEMCRNYYKTYFKPNVATLIIVGDINVKRAKKISETYFAKWQKGEVPKAVYTKPTLPQYNTVAFVDKPGAVQSTINIIYPLDLKPGDPDLIKAKVVNMMLGGGGFSGRLFQNLREKHSYTYGAYSSIQQDKVIGSFTAEAEVRNAVTDSAVIQFLYEMNRMVKEPASEAELTVIRNMMAGNFARSLEQSGTLAEFAYNTLRYKLPADYYATYLEKLSAITVADVQQTAAKYIRPENSIILVVGNKDEIAKTLSSFDKNKKVTFYDAQGNVVKENTTSIPAGVTSQTVIDSYLKAIGGLTALQSIKSAAINLNGAIQGQNLVLQIRYKDNKQYASSMKMGAMVVMRTVLNNNVAKQSGMQGSKDITGVELNDLLVESTLAPELNYSSLGVKHALKGIANINGSDCYQVELVLPSGKKKTDFYDVKSGLKLRTLQTEEGPQGQIVVTSDFSNYKETKGILLPNEISQSAGPMQFVFKVESAFINEGTTDDDFKL